MNVQCKQKSHKIKLDIHSVTEQQFVQYAVLTKFTCLDTDYELFIFKQVGYFT